MKKLISLVLCLWVWVSNGAEIEIILVNETPKEQKIKADLEALLTTYDLSKWQYTDKIRVDEKARTPYSHPVLTMSTQKEYLKSKTKLLSTYLHEQFHWHVIINGIPTKEAFRQRIKEHFPNVQVGFPNGSRDEGSTLSHIIVCYLEFMALTKLIGEHDARLNLLSNGYYQWVFRTVTDPANKNTLNALLEEFGLTI